MCYNNEGIFIPKTQNPLLVTVGGAVKVTQGGISYDF